MASNYPTGLDSFLNPVGSDKLNNAVNLKKHATQHTNENDAIENIQEYVGVVGSSDPASLTYQLDNIVLTPGPTGPTGATGATGPTGATGATGTSAAFANDGVEKITATSFASFNRKLGIAVQSRISQRLYLSAFWAPINITVGTVSIVVDTIGTTSTSTLLGLYSLDGADAGTLVASTANDTVFLNTNGVRTKSFTVPVALTAGNRYAFALLQDGGTQATLAKYNIANAVGSVNVAFTTIPFEAAYRTGQTSLAAFTKADLTSNTDYTYFILAT